MRTWDDFLAGRSNVEPPEFWDFVKEWEKQFELFPRTKRVLWNSPVPNDAFLTVEAS
jgi:hypothetical protein